MSQNILNNFKDYNEYRKNLILPLDNEEKSELKIEENISINSKNIQDFSKPKQQKKYKGKLTMKTNNPSQETATTQDSYQSDLNDIRNKILSLGGSNKSVETEQTTQNSKVETVDNISKEETLTESHSAHYESSVDISIPDRTSEVIVQAVELDDEIMEKEVSEERPALTEHQIWQEYTRVNTKEVYETYLKDYPKGIYTISAQYRLKDMIKT